MKHVKTTLSLLITLALSLSLLSCSYSPIEPSAEDLTVVGNVGQHEVYLEELRYVALSYHALMISRYGDDAFTGEHAEERREELFSLVYDNITANYATIDLCAEAMIQRGEEAIVEKVDEYMTELFDELGSMSAYKDYLELNNATDHLLRFSVEISLMQNELLYVYTEDLGIIENDEEALMEIIEDEFIAVRHIFIPHSTPDAEQLILSAKQRIDAGQSFNAVMAELNEDASMSEAGIFILEGYMSEEYEDAAFKLRPGRYTDVVTDYNGYYIITRDEVDISMIWRNFSRLKQLWQTYTFYDIVDDYQRELEFIPNSTATEYINGLIANSK